MLWLFNIVQTVLYFASLVASILFAVFTGLDHLVLGYLRLIKGVEGCFVRLLCFRKSQSVKWCFKLSGMILVVVDGYRLFRSVKSELVLDSVNVVVGCIVSWLF